MLNSLSLGLSQTLSKNMPGTQQREAAGWMAARGAGAEMASGTEGFWLQHSMATGMGSSLSLGATESIKMSVQPQCVTMQLFLK